MNTSTKRGSGDQPIDLFGSDWTFLSSFIFLVCESSFLMIAKPSTPVNKTQQQNQAHLTTELI
jgi:hypothetical protein